tara:strand:+ start:356 stop:697 length:342 start_codon:yes stop_codon:yes gene_type:complete
MANLLKAEKLVKFKNGKEYKAKMSLDTILSIEQSLNMSILIIANSLSQNSLSLSQIITILTLSIRAGGNDVKDNDIKQTASENGIVDTIRVTGEVLTLALVSEDETESEEKKS